MEAFVRRKRERMFSDISFVGDYQMENLVECSVYSVLFEGKKSATGQPVLLRHWLTAHAAREEERRRIQAAVAALQAVQHPHLLPILDVCMDEQGITLASTRVSGETLGTRLAQRFLNPLPFEEALHIITQIGQALDALHQRHLFHGNLTPQAIFFSEPHQVWVGEYRLQEVLECIPNYQPDLEESIPLCWYMAPEQFSGICDVSTDQYALGCLAYHLLTGRVPFVGSARVTLCQKHMQEQPRTLTDLNPALPAWVEAAVLKALAKPPAERHSSVGAFLAALQPSSKDALADQDTAKTPTLDGCAAIPAQTAWSQELSPQTHLSASAVGAEMQRVISTVKDRTSVEKGQQIVSSPRRRAFAVMISVLFLILFLTALASRWFFFSASSAQSLSRKASPHVSQGSSTPTPIGSPAAVSLQPSPNSTTSPTPAVSPTPGTAPLPPPLAVTPLLDCVTPNGNLFLAEFGYRNPNAFVVTLPLGGKNLISPSSADGSPPTSFAAGSHHQVFQVHFARHGTVAWSLDGLTVTASMNSPRC